MSTPRDDLFAKFGPLFLEAILLLILEETNKLRTQLKMPLITKLDVTTQINNKLAELTPYEWMDNPL